MGTGTKSTPMVGNEFTAVQRPQSKAVGVATPIEPVYITHRPEPIRVSLPATPRPALATPALQMSAAVPGAAIIDSSLETGARQARATWLGVKTKAAHAGDAIHHHAFIVFALLILLVGSSGILVTGSYLSARAEAAVRPATAQTPHAPTIAGFSISVPASQVQSKLKTIDSQTISLTVGSQTTSVSSSTIQSWVQITASKDHSTDYLQVKPGAIVSSVDDLANQYVKAPVNQVSVTHADGSPSGVIVAGQNGDRLSDPGGLETQARGLAKNLLAGPGSQLNTPLQTVPYQAVTPAAFPKLVEVNLTTKQLYAYENGQIVQTYAVSAGKPSTPTPVGEFQIWDKTAKQTMVGPGYVQPNVPWINYFDHSGDAIHGVYWRPASVFGNINTSHGCVGLPVDEAEWMYNWAPIGTTVITYNQPIAS